MSESPLSHSEWSPAAIGGLLPICPTDTSASVAGLTNCSSARFLGAVPCLMSSGGKNKRARLSAPKPTSVQRGQAEPLSAMFENKRKTEVGELMHWFPNCLADPQTDISNPRGNLKKVSDCS